MSVSDNYLPQVRTHRPRWRPSPRRQDARLVTPQPDALRPQRLEHAFLLSVNERQKSSLKSGRELANGAFLSSFGTIASGAD